MSHLYFPGGEKAHRSYVLFFSILVARVPILRDMFVSSVDVFVVGPIFAFISACRALADLLIAHAIPIFRKLIRVWGLFMVCSIMSVLVRISVLG